MLEHLELGSSRHIDGYLDKIKLDAIAVYIMLQVPPKQRKTLHNAIINAYESIASDANTSTDFLRARNGENTLTCTITANIPIERGRIGLAHIAGIVRTARGDILHDHQVFMKSAPETVLNKIQSGDNISTIVDAPFYRNRKIARPPQEDNLHLIHLEQVNHITWKTFKKMEEQIKEERI